MFKPLLFILVGFPAMLSAQVTISGKVTDLKSNPLKGISVSILNTYDGATTDSTGLYSFRTSESGTQTLVFSGTGFKTSKQNILLNIPSISVSISLKELITELKAVSITVGAFEAGDQKKATILSSMDVVTTASANADITTAVKTLPGAQQVGETEGLFVRGGTANESKTFIDGTLVNNFYYSSQPGLAQRGRFNPFLFKGTIFSAGGYSALYGQALSSALILESIDLPEKSSADLAVSYLAVGGGLQKLSKDKKSSWGISYNYTDLRLAFKLIKQQPDYFNTPVIHNADANFRIRTSKTGMLKYYATVSATKVGFRYADIDSADLKDAFSLKNFNVYQNLSWKEKLGKGLRMNTGLSFSTNRDNITGELQNQNDQRIFLSNPQIFENKNFGLQTHGLYANGKMVIEKKFKGLSAIRFGSEYNYSNDQSAFSSNSITANETVKENLVSGFAESDVYITNQLAAKTGIRVEHSSLLNKWNAAPRISLAYKSGENSQASIAYGVFYQDPEKKYLPAFNELTFSKASHYIAQFQKLTPSHTFRTEIFYKKYDDLYKTQPINGKERAVNNNGSGEAKGIEVFWRDKKTFKNFDYWISYSYLDTKRDYLNYPSSIEPPFAAAHTTSLVMKKFVMKYKTQFNASYTFATGRPYYNFMLDNNKQYQITDAGRTKDFNNLSFSVNYLPNLGNTKSKIFTVVVFSVTNVLGANNIYSYNYSANGTHKVAVTPPAKRFFYLGCFISLGIDRTQQAIDNNL